MQYPMPPARIPSLDPRNLHRHQGLIQQRHNPTHRPHKSLRLARAPVHVFRPVKRQHFLRQLCRQQLRRRASQLLHRRAHILALGVRHFLQCRHVQARLLRKGLRHSRRYAIFERHLPWRPRQLLLGIRLRRQHIFNQHSQPSRRRIRLHRPRTAQQPLPLQQLLHTLAQLGLGPCNHPRRNLVQPYLK